ncbi:MAG: hypothetical protein DRO99_00720 [Candidatus Aenigmatarchaeota archaeon]|nr:MAG: hypothetical protein DRO99_00720 [Candidatus Aenigmarchaeota archaeon]
MVMESNENRVLEGLFLRDKPAKILLGLHTSDDPVYVTILSKEANCTYSHTIKILDALKEMGIVDFEKKGRIKQVVLTEEGAEIAKHMDAMIKRFLKLESSEKKAPKSKKNDKKPRK